MSKKGGGMPSEATSWGLGILILIVLMFIFFPNLMGGIKDSVLSFGQWAVADPEKPRLSNEMPEDLKKNIDSFFSLLEKNKGGVGGCLLKYDKLDVPKEHSIQFSEYGGGYTGWVFKLQGKEGGFRIDLPVVGGLKPCIVNAENFYNQYLADTKTDTGEKHIDSGIEIKKDEILFNKKEYDFEQTYLFKSDKEHICFILTDSDLGWSCDAPKGYALDNDCIDELEKKVPICSKEEEWNKIQEDYKQNKCVVDKYTCETEKMPCKCFTKELYDKKESPEECTDKEPYCYDMSTVGCSAEGPDRIIEACKNSNPDFEQAPVCRVDDETFKVAEIDTFVVTTPCTCPDSKDLGIINNEFRKDGNLVNKLWYLDFVENLRKEGKLKDPIEVCKKDQYCDFGERGCVDNEK